MKWKSDRNIWERRYQAEKSEAERPWERNMFSVLRNSKETSVLGGKWTEAEREWKWALVKTLSFILGVPLSIESCWVIWSSWCPESFHSGYDVESRLLADGWESGENSQDGLYEWNGDWWFRLEGEQQKWWKIGLFCCFEGRISGFS